MGPILANAAPASFRRGICSGLGGGCWGGGAVPHWVTQRSPSACRAPFPFSSAEGRYSDPELQGKPPAAETLAAREPEVELPAHHADSCSWRQRTRAEWGRGSQLRTGAKRSGRRVCKGVQGGRHRMECRRGAWAVGLEAAGVDGGSDGHGEPASLVTIATSTGRVLHQQPRHVPRGRVCPGDTARTQR